MKNDHPLTLTVEQAAKVLGIGRSTAYELVRSGDLKHIRLRRRIVVPISHVAGRLDIDRDAIWTMLAPPGTTEPPRPLRFARSNGSTSRQEGARVEETPPLF